MSNEGVNGRGIDDDTDTDDAELEELFRLVARAFAECDPAPPVEEGGMSYVRWAAPDADLGVMFDSELVGVRDDSDGSDEREFVGVRYRIAVGISPERIVGEVSPWSVGSVLTLEYEGGPRVVETDDEGEFFIDSPPGGPVRFRLESTVGAMVTEWFSVNPTQNS
jgi:hypothetical protein